MASLCNGMLLCNGYVAFEIAASKYFINKDFLFLIRQSLQKEQLFYTMGDTEKYWSVVKDFSANKIAALGNKLQY